MFITLERISSLVLLGIAGRLGKLAREFSVNENQILLTSKKCVLQKNGGDLSKPKQARISLTMINVSHQSQQMDRGD